MADEIEIALLESILGRIGDTASRSEKLTMWSYDGGLIARGQMMITSTIGTSSAPESLMAGRRPSSVYCSSVFVTRSGAPRTG